MQTTILERVLSLNPWFRDPLAWERELERRLPRPFIPRAIDRSGLDDPRRAKLIVGPRQAGKSTLVWWLLRDREPEKILYLLGEEERVRFWTRSAVGFLNDLEQAFPEVRTIFLDEAQHLDDAGLFVKGLVDARRGLDVIVTGSGAFHLESRTRESLAGRAVRRRLLPLSIAEILDWEAPAVPGVRTRRTAEIARRQLVYGGYPRPWFDDDPAPELRELVEAFVIRDASDRFSIRLPDAFRRVLMLAAGQAGQMINLTEWAGIVGVSTPTVSDWLGLLEETWVLRQLPPFAGGRRREITTARRVHFYDPGLRNALLNTFETDIDRRQDKGALLETLAFVELTKALPLDAQLHYWRAKGGAEVDFVVVRGNRMVPIEVRAGDRGRVSRSLRSFVDAYQPEAAFVACGALEEPREGRLGGTTVRFVSLERVGPEVASVW
jgi:predicted AAA+ superfamily ATPase